MIPVDFYVLEGFTLAHDVAERSETFVTSVCGQVVHVSRLVKFPGPNHPRCLDCKLLSEAQAISRQRGAQLAARIASQAREREE